MRTKTKYSAHVKGSVRPEGRCVIIPISVDKDPDRVVELRIPRSQAPGTLRAAVKAIHMIDGNI